MTSTKEYLVKDSDSLDSLLKIDVTITNPEGEPPSNVWVEDLGRFVWFSPLEGGCYLLPHRSV